MSFPALPSGNNPSSHEKPTKARWGSLFRWKFQLALPARNLKLATQSLASNGLRSLLTLCGLMLGILSIIIMITLSVQTREVFTRYFDTKGGRKAVISFDEKEATRKGLSRWRGYHVDQEIRKLSTFFQNYGRIDPIVSVGPCTLTSLSNTHSGLLRGVDKPEELVEADLQLQRGRFFIPEEYQSAGVGRTALLGSKAAEKLFPPNDPGFLKNETYPIGETLRFEGCSVRGVVTIVGILKTQDSAFDDDKNGDIYIPSRTLLGFGANPYRTRLSAVPHQGVSPTWFAQSVKNFITLQTSNQFPFRSFVPEQYLEKVNLMLTVFQGLTVIIGGLCTVIGGVGVMNIMLVNIAERIREIGIRKAIGARSIRIRNQFLCESVALCVGSGILGLILGTLICNLVVYGVAKLMPQYVSYSFVWNGTSIVLALLTSLLSGIVFGLIPAVRAGTLDVNEALRQE